jgi:zinc transport system permease protein
VALAILFYGGISGGVVLVSLSAGGGSRSLLSYLFGSPLTTSAGDLVVVAVLAVGVLGVALVLRPWLFAVCHDEDHARVSGLPVRAINLTLAVTAAITVTAAMRTVGLLLVSALMVVPVATAQRFSRGFAATMTWAMVLGVAAATVGLWVAWQVDSAPGATIVLVSITAFVAVTVAGAVWRSSRRASGDPPDASITVGEPPEVLLDR